MKKIISFIVLILLMIANTFAYDATPKDDQLVKALTSKIELIIKEKGESVRGIFIEKFISLQNNGNISERLKYIIGELVVNINDSIESINKIIEEVEKQQIGLNDTASALLLLEEYNNIYYDFSNDNIYGNNGNFEGGCGTFSEKWKDVYYDQFQDLYNKANDFNNFFLMDLIKHDFTTLNSFIKDSCGNTTKIKGLEYNDIGVQKLSTSFNNSYYLSTYITYNDWYYRLNTYFQNTTAGVTCNDVWVDWDTFTYDKLEFVKNYSKDTGSLVYTKYFEELQDKYRDMMKNECNGIKIK